MASTSTWRVPGTSGRRSKRPVAPISSWRRFALNAALVVGAGLVAATGVIHLDVWANHGYRDIPVIGPLFLFQFAASFILVLALLASRRFLVIVAAAGFLIATIGGYLLSIYVGLFGLHDSLAAPHGGMSLVIEGSGTAVLVLAGALVPSSDRLRLPRR